jgi:probable HAF family extracellular repeat protein
LPGDRSSTAAAINASGQIAGESWSDDGIMHAVMWNDGTVTALGSLDDGSETAQHGMRIVWIAQPAGDTRRRTAIP